MKKMGPLLLFLTSLISTAVSECSTAGFPKANRGSYDPGDKYIFDTDDSVTITCKYAAKNGDNSVKSTCSPDGTWQPTLTMCVVCNKDEDCTKATCDEDNDCVCKDRFYLNKLNATLCETVSCELEVDHANLVPDKDKYDDTDTVAVTCDSNYILKDDSASTTFTVTCQGETGVWQPAASTCVPCNTDQDCTNGKCIGNICKCNTSENYVLNLDNPQECKLVECGDFNCNHGACNVRDGERECICDEGVEGDICDRFTNDLCEANGQCLHGSKCSQASSDEYDCDCSTVQKYNATGKNCQYPSQFQIRPDASKRCVGIKNIDEQKVSVEYATIENPQRMMIMAALLSGVDAIVYAVAVLQTGYDSLSIQFTPQPESSTNPKTFIYSVENLDLKSSLYNTLGLRLKGDYLDESGNTVELVLNTVPTWSDSTGPASIRFTKIFALQVGGSSNCFGNFGDLADDFYGAFGTVLYGEERATLEQIIKPGIATTSLSCSTVICKNSESCSLDDIGRPICTCKPGYGGPRCSMIQQMSFNGYSSLYEFDLESHTSFGNDYLASEIKIALNVHIDNTDKESGPILKVTSETGCDFSLKTKNEGDGQLFFFADHPDETVSASPNTSITLVFNGETVTWRSLKSESCSYGSTKPKLKILLGGESDNNTAPNNFHGCLDNFMFTVGGITSSSILKSTDAGSVKVDECVTDYMPPDPCNTPNACNGQQCVPNPFDYSVSCSCTPPMVGDSQCARKNYCELDLAEGGCQADSTAKCFEIMEKTLESCIDTAGLTSDKCAELIKKPVWYYYCDCKADYKGDQCTTKEEAVINEKSDQTTIIVVVVIVAIVLVLVVIVLLVRRRKEQGSSGDTYSPRAVEKEIELSPASAKTEDVLNIYDDPEIIRNPNVESISMNDNEKRSSPSPPPFPESDAVAVETVALDIMDAPTKDGGSIDRENPEEEKDII